MSEFPEWPKDARTVWLTPDEVGQFDPQLAGWMRLPLGDLDPIVMMPSVIKDYRRIMDGPDGLSVFERELAGPTITVEFNATGSMNAGIRALDERGDTMSEDMPRTWWDGTDFRWLYDEPRQKLPDAYAMSGDHFPGAVGPDWVELKAVDPATMSLVEVPTRRLLQELQLRFRAQEDELQARREGREPEEWIHGDVPGL